MVSKILVVVFIFFCFELGLFLIIFPWSQYWENNFFLSYAPYFRELVLSNYCRGAISGLGIVDVGIGILEAMHFKQAVAHVNYE
ncbi:MAG: hypothetical protein U0V70_19630 [Terriglobia bacterium]